MKGGVDSSYYPCLLVVLLGKPDTLHPASGFPDIHIIMSCTSSKAYAYHCIYQKSAKRVSGEFFGYGDARKKSYARNNII